MAEQVSFVVAFPSLFARNKTSSLVSNIKKILKIRGQQFQSIRKDGELIVIEANDPVFASSAVNTLFGVQKVAIARRTTTDFETLVSEITKLGGNLLLKGDTFLVKVDGTPKGYLPKDLEMAATSSIIEKKSKLGAKPGTQEKFDKLLYTFITKNNSYICIFLDEGNGGIPYNYHKQNVLCGVFDELSAASCVQCIKCGYAVKIVAFHTKDKSELRKLAKTLNLLLPLTLQKDIQIEFYQVPIKSLTTKTYQKMLESVIEVMLEARQHDTSHVSVPLDPQIFSASYIDKIASHIRESNAVPVFPVFGLNEELKRTSKMIRWENLEKDIERLAKLKTTTKDVSKDVQKSLHSKKTVNITLGPNNVHDILDSLEEK